MSVQRWKLTIEYDGSAYSGWQKQEAGIKSVQEEIERALFQFCQQEIKIFAAGRTDAGVHARGQVAHFDIDYGARELNSFDLLRALNALLRTQNIAILKAEMVHATFHARFDAVSKTYRYRVFNRTAKPVMDFDYVWHVYGALDIDGMRQAAQYLIGHHDFSSFRATNCQAKHPRRTIDVAEIDCHGDYIDFIFKGQSFLHHQVRNMVGSLIMVGRKKWPPQKIYEVLMAKNRVEAGPTAPPQALCLEEIFYPNQ